MQPKVDYSNDLKATPKHLPDIDNFPVKNNIPYSHQISPPLNFCPPGGRKLKGANWEPKLGAKIKGNELGTENWRGGGGGGGN